KGCADLGVNTTLAADPAGWTYSIPSPDGTYVAEGFHHGSHGCHSITIYQCVNQQSSGRIGCEGIYPTDSSDLVFANKWTSDHELSISRAGDAQIINALEIFDADSEQAQAYDQMLSVSPDGDWQIFRSFRDGMSELYRMRLDNTDVQRLTH